MGHLAEGYALVAEGLVGMFTSPPNFAGFPGCCWRAWIRVGRLCFCCSDLSTFSTSGLCISAHLRKICRPVTFSSLILTWGDFTPQETFGSVGMHFWLSQLGRGCYCHLVGRGQRCCQHAPPPHHPEELASRLRNPAFTCLLSTSPSVIPETEEQTKIQERINISICKGMFQVALFPPADYVLENISVIFQNILDKKEGEMIKTTQHDEAKANSFLCFMKS